MADVWTAVVAGAAALVGAAVSPSVQRLWSRSDDKKARRREWGTQVITDLRSYFEADDNYLAAVEGDPDFWPITRPPADLVIDGPGTAHAMHEWAVQRARFARTRWEWHAAEWKLDHNLGSEAVFAYVDEAENLVVAWVRFAHKMSEKLVRERIESDDAQQAIDAKAHSAVLARLKASTQ